MLLEDLKYNIAKCVDNSTEALEVVYSDSLDLILMDIEITGRLNGQELAQEIAHLNIPILFICSRKYEKAYKATPRSKMTGFLIKPIEKLYLKSSIQKAILRSQSQILNVDESKIGGNIITDDKFYFKKRDIYQRVNINDIAYVRSDDNYCNVWTTQGKNFTSRITISKLEAMLPDGKFVRTHRQYLVQLDAIDTVALHNSTCKVIGQEIPVSRSKRKDLESILNIMR